MEWCGPDNKRPLNTSLIAVEEFLMPLPAVGEKAVIMDIDEDKVRELLYHLAELRIDYPASGYHRRRRELI